MSIFRTVYVIEIYLRNKWQLHWEESQQIHQELTFSDEILNISFLWIHLLYENSLGMKRWFSGKEYLLLLPRTQVQFLAPHDVSQLFVTPVPVAPISSPGL